VFCAFRGDGAQTKVIAPLHIYLRLSLAKFHQLLQIIRHEPLKEQAEQINQGLRGHYAYYGIADNMGSLPGVYRHVERYWRAMLSSRSQQRKVCWEVFLAIKRKYPLPASKAQPALYTAEAIRRAVKHRLKSVVRDIRTLRSVRAGGG
jgi:hypothetical protein